MLVRFKCPRCGNSTNPIDNDRLPDHSIIQCTDFNCLNEFSIIGAEAQFVRSPLFKPGEGSRDADLENRNAARARGFNIRPASAFGNKILGMARRFTYEGNPCWSRSEKVEQCQNHLMLRNPEISENEAHYAAEIAVSEAESFRWGHNEFDLALSTPKALCITTYVNKSPSCHPPVNPLYDIRKTIVPLSKVMEHVFREVEMDDPITMG